MVKYNARLMELMIRV